MGAGFFLGKYTYASNIPFPLSSHKDRTALGSLEKGREVDWIRSGLPRAEGRMGDRGACRVVREGVDELGLSRNRLGF